MLSNNPEKCRYSDKQILSEGEDMKIDPTKNTIICGDNIEWLNWIPDESIDLCYIDPPFFTQRDFKNIWGDPESVADFESNFFDGFQDTKDFFERHIKSDAIGKSSSFILRVSICIFTRNNMVTPDIDKFSILTIESFGMFILESNTGQSAFTVTKSPVFPTSVTVSKNFIGFNTLSKIFFITNPIILY